MTGQTCTSSETSRYRYSRHNAYQKTALYFSPFTLVIGPSGIGKSFLTKQLAHQNHAYVVYVCLATNDAHPYPLQSPAASLFARPSTRDQMTTLVECFVAAGLAHVKLCKSVGINAIRFYEMQVRENFSSLQNIFRDCLEEFFNKVMRDLRAARKTRRVRSNDVEPDEDYDYNEYVDKSLQWYESLLASVFGELKKELQKSEVFQSFLSTKPIGLGLQPGEPAAIICFDEARSLFSQ